MTPPTVTLPGSPERYGSVVRVRAWPDTEIAHAYRTTPEQVRAVLARLQLAGRVLQYRDDHKWPRWWCPGCYSRKHHRFLPAVIDLVEDAQRPNSVGRYAYAECRCGYAGLHKYGRHLTARGYGRWRPADYASRQRPNLVLDAPLPGVWDLVADQILPPTVVSNIGIRGARFDLVILDDVTSGGTL